MCFPDMLLRYFLNDFEMVPYALIITGIAFVFTLQMRCVSVVSSPVTGLEWPGGFQEVKVPRFHDNGTGWC